MEDIIKQLQTHHKHVRGIMLHCDEFQNLNDKVGTDNDKFETTRGHLETLNEGFHKTGPNLPIITIFSGIPPADSTLASFLTRSSSATVVELLPVDGYPVTDPRSTYCTQILQDYIEHGQAIDEHNFSIPLPTLHQWGCECEGHVVHANHAGATIQQYLRERHNEGQTTIDDDDYGEIHRLIKVRRKDYYEERLDSLKDTKNPISVREAARTLLPHLIIAIDDQRKRDDPAKSPAFLTLQYIEHLSKSFIPDAALREKALTLLVRCGAIRNMLPRGRFIRYWSPEDAIDLPYVDIPIPTMGEHILQPYTEDQQNDFRATNQQLLQDFKGFNVTQWKWGNKPRTPMLSQSHHFEYHMHREPHHFTQVEADQAALEVHRTLAIRWLPNQTPNHDNWLELIHDSTPQE